MKIHPFIDEGLGNSAYLVEIGDRRAIAIDPPRDVSALRRAAEDRGLSVAYAIETHLHADFISGSQELSAIGATVVGARAANLDFAHRGLEGGETLDLGGLTLEAIATPGHTPEPRPSGPRRSAGNWPRIRWPLVFVLGEAQDRSDLVRQALGIGYEELAGEIAGGFEAWRDAGRPVAATTLTRTADAGPVLDVRQASEVESSHVRGAVAIELGALSRDLPISLSTPP